jgi:hypothetical protein
VRGVFVSHSSIDRAFTEQVCAALGPYIEDDVAPPPGSFRSLVDWKLVVDFDDLVEGDPWPDQLHEWLARCHAGLILLTPAAVKSAWVLKEATILSWRHSRDPDQFRLFITKHPGVDDALLRTEKFAPLELPRVQWINNPDPAAIATFVHERLGGEPPPRTLFDELVGDLTDLMSSVKDNARRKVAEAVCAEQPAWRADRDGTQQYCEAIAQRLLRGNFGRLGGVGDLIETIVAATPTDTLESIFKLVAPYWVDAGVAGALPLLARRTPPGVAAMNGNRVPMYTARMYATRAHMNPFTYIYIPVASANAGDCVADVSRQIRERVERLANRSMTLEEVVDWLAGAGLPVYVVLPFVPVPDDLDDLRGTFGNVAFVLSTGPALDRDHEIRDVQWLEPALDTGIETKQEQSYNKGATIIRIKRSGSD